MIEEERVSNNLEGQTPPSTQVIISVEADFPQETLDRIVSVFSVILRAIKINWPEDSWWEKQLPDWFIGSFNHSMDEILKNESLWDFGSWLDANKYRGWEWWSTEVSDVGLCIKLHACDDPYVIGPFEYLIRTSGGVNIKIEELY